MKARAHSEVGGYVFDYYLSDNQGYAKSHNLRGISWLRFWIQIILGYYFANRKLRLTIKRGLCFYGPFKGEFGHFLAHTLPFLVFLHSKKVKIIYCGIEIHEPFLLDEEGKSILHEFVKLRDFFSEVAPSSNSTVLPKDLQRKVNEFHRRATKSNAPFWNIADPHYYWFVHRNWLSKKNTMTYDLSKAYRQKKENACVIVPRTKSSKANHNNGEAWNYEEVIAAALTCFDRVYICGHPSQVADIRISDPRVVLSVSTDNTKIIQSAAASKVIITQHSGVVYLGEYTGTDVLIIYKGGASPTDIGSLNNTLRFRMQFKGISKLNFAFSISEIGKVLNLNYRSKTN